MLLPIHPENPQARYIQQVVTSLLNDGVIIYPTDTIYGLGCDMNNQKAIEKICRLRNLNPSKIHLSIICKDISQLSEFTLPINNTIFRLLKKNLPGPFTFIFKGHSRLPKMFKNKRKTIGVRIPDNAIALAIIEALGRPILSISLKSDDEILEYLTDPYEIEEQFGKQVDLVIDGGVGGNEPSTVVNCVDGEPEIIRQGVGELIE